MAIPKWTYIPTSILDQEERENDANEWAARQRQQLADEWAERTRAQIAEAQQDWRQQIAPQREDRWDFLTSPRQMNPLQAVGDLAGIIGAGFEEVQEHFFDPMTGLTMGEHIGRTAQNRARQEQIDAGMEPTIIESQGRMSPELQALFERYRQQRILNPNTPMPEELKPWLQTPTQQAPAAAIEPEFDIRRQAQEVSQWGGAGAGWERAGSLRRELQPDITEQMVYDLVNPASWLGPEHGVALARGVMKAAPVVSKAAAPVLREGVQAAGRVAREIGEQAPDVARRLATEEAGFARLGKEAEGIPKVAFKNTDPESGGPRGSIEERFGTLGGVRNVGKAGRPTSTNPATQKLFDMYYGPKLKGADATVRQRVKDFATKATQWFTDRNVSVSELVHMAERAAGVKEGGLPVEMQADLLMRLNPDKAAAVHLQEGLQPAIQSVGDDLPYLDAYLTHQNNIDVARSIGQKVERSVMSERIKPSLAARNLNAERGTLRLKEYRAKVLEAGDQKKLVRYDELNDQYGKAQDDLTRLDEQLYEKAQELDMLKAPSEMVRPPKNLFVGWTEGQIQEFAEREGRNVFQPDWWDKLDPIAIKDARSSLSRGGGKTKQIGQLKAELSRIKAERAKMLADSKSLEGQMESVLNGIDTEAGNRLKAEIAERQKRITRLEKRVYDDTERALGRQRREAMTKGADAEANRMFSGGLRVADSEQALANLPNELGSERYAKVEQAANQVYALVDQLRARLVKSGVWSQELADTLKQQYPHYVQTYILEKHADSPMGVGGKGIGLSDRQLRQLTIKGTEKDREAPLGSMVRMVFQTEQMARKNDVFNAFVRLRDTLAQSDPAWSSRIRQIEDPSDIVKSGPNAEHVIQGYQNGNKVMYAVPKELGLAYEAKDGVIPILKKLMTLFKMGATSRNPLFLSGNAVMDAMTFISRESVRAGGSQHLPKIVKALAEGYIDAFKGLPSGTYKGDTANLLKGGGGIFGYFQSKPEMTAKMVQYLRQRNALDIRGKDDLLHLLKQLATGEPVEAIGERVELAPRVASYKLAKKAGKADQLAVDAARSVTMDFARGGTASKLLDQFIPFFNVGMQSPAQVVRAWKENPKGFIATAVELLAGPTVAVEAWNRSDPQRAKDYEDVPQYVKDQGIVIMLPVEAPIDKQGNRRPQFVFLRTREYTPFVSLTREAVNRVMGGNPRDWADLIGRGVLSSTSPVSGSSGSEIASGIQMPVAGTFTQLMTNRDLYRDKHIASQYADEQASAFSKTLAEWTNTRPSQVEFAIRDIGSGVAGMGLAASDAFTGNLRGGNTPQDIPGIGGVAGRFIRGSTGQRLEEAQQAAMSQDVQDILRREGITYNIGQVQRTINGVPLTMDEQTSYQQLVNELVEKNIMATVKTPVWATLTAEQKERQIQRMVALAKDQARAQIMEGKAATPTGRGSSASPLPAGVQRWTGPR